MRQDSFVELPRDMHARYSIFAYGCSNTVYRVIHPDEMASYQSLLASRDFLGAHHRQDAASLGAVRELKPFWAIGKDCYSWIDQPILQGNFEMQEKGEGGSVGLYQDEDEDWL
jgi:hypothetical protein